MAYICRVSNGVSKACRLSVTEEVEMVLRCCRQLRVAATKNAHGGIAQEHVHTIAQALATAKISNPFTWLLSASMANRVERRLLELNWLLEHDSSESWVAPTMPDTVYYL